MLNIIPQHYIGCYIQYNKRTWLVINATFDKFILQNQGGSHQTMVINPHTTEWKKADK